MTELDRQRGSLWISLGVGLLLIMGLFVYFSRSSVASVQADPDYRFDPRRVDLGQSHPDWLENASLKLAFFASYLRVAGPTFSLLDEESIAAFEARLKTSSWIENVQAKPVLPHSMDLDLTLRRPVAATVDQQGHLWLLAEDGMPLRLIRNAKIRELEQHLASLRLSRGPLALPGEERTWTSDIRPFGLPLLFGGLALDVHVPAGESARKFPAEGAQIAALVQNHVLPSLRRRWPELPPFLGVDISNGGLRLLLAHAEYRLIFLDPLGRPVYLSWGHPPTSPFDVIPWQTKERIFRRLLEGRPGLEGIHDADLRFDHSWRGLIDLRAGQDDEAHQGGGR